MKKPIASMLMKMVFPPKTVASVLGQFEKVIADLNEIQEVAMTEAAEERKEADRLLKSAAVREAESSRAAAVSNNIHKLISTT